MLQIAVQHLFKAEEFHLPHLIFDMLRHRISAHQLLNKENFGNAILLPCNPEVVWRLADNILDGLNYANSQLIARENELRRRNRQREIIYEISGK